MTESSFGFEHLSVHKALAPWWEAVHERGDIVVARWDAEQSDWASRKRGGAGIGQRGFLQPQMATFGALGVKPYSVTMSLPHEHNAFTRAGWTRVVQLALASGATQAYDATHTRIGVGTATQAAATGDTDLIATTGPTARFFQLVTGAGTTAAGTGGANLRLTFVATAFGTGDANIAWQEWGIDQGTAGSGTAAATAPLLNRAVSAQGTKTSGQTWTATANLDFT